MKKIKFGEMLPCELLQIQKEGKPIYLPIGSMEWHSLHLGMGVDTLHAEKVAMCLAEEIGGAVFPPLYIGTEEQRTPASLKKLGMDEKEKVMGMDFPQNSLKSCYWNPALFKQIIKTQIQMLLDMGFPKIVLLNGHGSFKQKALLDELCSECKSKGKTVISIFTLFADCGVGLGHAGLAETALMQAIAPEMVDLSQLPEKPEKLYYRDYGIADAGGNESEPFVHFDPRDSSAEIGFQMLRFEVEKCKQIILNE